jgi:hypothetical protein
MSNRTIKYTAGEIGRVPYQRMIRALVDTYAERQAGGKRKS